jgi:divalent metal cation (Fe/Co/Zn/Cd) transporter
MLTAIVAAGVMMGASQALRVAWVENMLALIPPIAFLVAARRTRKPPTPDHPYGYHRSVAVGHLTSAVALLAVGLLLVEDSAMALLRQEHPLSIHRSALCASSATRYGPAG